MKNYLVFAWLFASSFLLSCNLQSQNWGNGIKGEGPQVTKTIDLPSFNGLVMAIDGDVYLRQGSPQSVKVEAQQNIIDNLERDVNRGVWKIGFDKNVRHHEGIKIWITIPDLNEVSVSGSGSVKGENTFTGVGDLRLAVSGSGDIHLDADSKAVEAAISGSGSLDLGGITGNCSMSISGSGDIVAFNLQAQQCMVRISGSGDASVYARESLDATIAGSGNVYYKGSARVKSKISGSGDVISK